MVRREDVGAGVDERARYIQSRDRLTSAAAGTGAQTSRATSNCEQISKYILMDGARRVIETAEQHRGGRSTHAWRGSGERFGGCCVATGGWFSERSLKTNERGRAAAKVYTRSRAEKLIFGSISKSAMRSVARNAKPRHILCIAA